MGLHAFWRMSDSEDETPNAKRLKLEKQDAPPPTVQNITNNTTNNNIHNYFSRVAGPTVAEEDTRPENLFPQGERQNNGYVPCGGKTRAYRKSHATRDGGLKAGCTNCTRNYLDMVQFAPPKCNNNARRRPHFVDALQDYSKAYEERDLEAAREARSRVEKLRNGKCLSCQESNSGLSPAEQACKDEYIRMRKEACTKNDGCANPECAERGEQAWCVLQGDHLHTRKEEDETLRKKKALSNYPWWAGNGGVEAMRAEEAKGMQWLCGFCHFLEPTSDAANRYEDPDTMPDGKSSGTPEEVKQYKKKNDAKIRFPKQQYVDQLKREAGCCARCKRSDVEGNEVAFHWDHRDPATKLKGRDTLAGEQTLGLS